MWLYGKSTTMKFSFHACNANSLVALWWLLIYSWVLSPQQLSAHSRCTWGNGRRSLTSWRCNRLQQNELQYFTVAKFGKKSKTFLRFSKPRSNYPIKIFLNLLHSCTKQSSSNLKFILNIIDDHWRYMLLKTKLRNSQKYWCCAVCKDDNLFFHRPYRCRAGCKRSS